MGTEERHEFDYMMLGRLMTDCHYYLEGGGGERQLWAHDVDAQLAKMQELWDKVPEKPVWLTREDFEILKSQMIEEKTAREERLGNRKAEPEAELKYWLHKQTGECMIHHGPIGKENYTQVDVSRIDKINIYPDTQTGRHRLRCNIDGKGQMSQVLSPAQDRIWQIAVINGLNGMAKLRLASEIHADKLLQPVNESVQQRFRR